MNETEKFLIEYLKLLIKSGDYCEIHINNPEIDITGYNGYEATRYSSIEKTQVGIKLKEYLQKFYNENK